MNKQRRTHNLYSIRFDIYIFPVLEIFLVHQDALIKNKTLTNSGDKHMVNKRIFVINLTFRMLSNIHIFKSNRYSVCKNVCIVRNRGLEPKLRKKKQSEQ